MIHKIFSPNSTEKAFSYIALYWVILSAGAFLLALFDIFYMSFFIAYFLLGIALFISPLSKNLRKSLRPLTLPTSIIILIVSIWASFGTATVFTGRDQGSIATAAISLAQNHSLTASVTVLDTFFSFYGEGYALNFPGFFYTEDGALITQFPIPYIAWIAVFYGLFGILGFVIANSILFILFALSLALLAQNIFTHLHKKQQHKNSQSILFLTLLFTLTSFSFMWFFRHTLSENLAQFLLFFMILQTVLFVASCKTALKEKQNPSFFYFWTALLTATLIVFTRIEGIVFFVLMLCIFIITPQTYAAIRTHLISHLFLPTLALLLLFAIVFDKTTNFYKSIIKALLPSKESSVIANTPFSSLSEMLSRYTDYLSYSMLPFLVIGIFCIYILLRKKSWYALLPLFIVFPIFIYLINPHISNDAPWMLRRLSFAILPIGILYSIIFIMTQSKNVRIVLTITLLTLSLPAYIYFFTFSENKSLLSQVNTFSKQFTSNDLILIDKNVTGNHFGMITGPLRTMYKKNAAYFFNPDDLTRINFSQFDNIFLILPEDNIARYLEHSNGKYLSEHSRISFSTSRLSHSHTFWHFPKKELLTTNNIIYKIDIK